MDLVKNRAFKEPGKPITIKKNLLLTLLFLMVTSILISVYIIKSNKLSEASDQQVMLKEELKEMEVSEDLLKKEIEKLEDPEYVANLARRDYYLSKDDEYIFRTK